MPGICIGGPEDGRRVAARGAPSFLRVHGHLYHLKEVGLYLYAGHTHRVCEGCGAYNVVTGGLIACQLCGGNFVDAVPHTG